MNWKHLDTQMQFFSDRLTIDVKLTPEMAARLATTISSDVRFLSLEARKGIDPNEPLEQFEVEQDDLSFWQALSRCVAYAAYSNL